MPEGAGLLAKGNINPSVFVKSDPSNSFGCLQCGANEKVLGISQVGTHDPPGVTGATAYAASDGQSLQVFQDGDVCLLLAGSGGYTSGDYLKSDANGAGVPVGESTATLQYYGAQALQTAAYGEYGRVKVNPGQVKPA